MTNDPFFRVRAWGPVALLLLSGCGRIGPGGANRPGYEYTDASSSETTSGSGGGSSEGYKSVYDDKGCVIGVGESGSKQQAACRSGK
jgi:hypothetical protein